MENTATQPGQQGDVISIKGPVEKRPAPFGRRFIAAIVDSLIIGIVCMPVTVGVTMVVAAFSNGSAAAAMGIAFPYMVQLIAMFFYYGWFYQNKGASPGKLLLGLKVVTADTGTNLSFGHTFLREGLGKFLINTFTLGIGYLIALFRDDNKALHDIIFSTQVWYEPKK